MNRRIRGFLLLLFAALLLGFPNDACAHLGSPNAIFEGAAGPYPVRIIVKPPGVVPGLAEVNVRVLEGRASKVSLTPVYWRTGADGAPAPDQAKPVPGAEGLFSYELWLMVSGAYSVVVEVDGDRGKGTAIAPVNSLATRVMSVPNGLGWILAGMGVGLFILACSIVGAAAKESGRMETEAVSKKDRVRGGAAWAIAALILALGLWGGKAWWDSEDSDYRSRRVFRPTECKASIRTTAGQRVLDFEITDPSWGRGEQSRLTPDHGKLIHLFMVKAGQFDAFFVDQRVGSILEIEIVNCHPSSCWLAQNGRSGDSNRSEEHTS